MFSGDTLKSIDYVVYDQEKYQYWSSLMAVWLN